MKRRIVAFCGVLLMLLGLAGCANNFPKELEGKWQIDKVVTGTVESVPEQVVQFVFDRSGNVIVYVDGVEKEKGKCKINSNGTMTMTQENIETTYSYSLEGDRFEFWKTVTDAFTKGEEVRRVLRKVE